MDSPEIPEWFQRLKMQLSAYTVKAGFCADAQLCVDEIERLRVALQEAQSELDKERELRRAALGNYDAAHHAAMHYMNDPCDGCVERDEKLAELGVALQEKELQLESSKQRIIELLGD